MDRLSVAHEVLDSIAKEVSEDVDAFYMSNGDPEEVHRLE
jgi:hypothetical protein